MGPIKSEFKIFVPNENCWNSSNTHPLAAVNIFFFKKTCPMPHHLQSSEDTHPLPTVNFIEKNCPMPY